MSKITVSIIDHHLNEHINQADRYMSQGKFDHALANLYRALSLAEVLNDAENLKQIRLRIAVAHHDQGQAEQVIDWCQLSLEDPLEPELVKKMVELKALNFLRLGYFIQARQLLASIQDDENLDIRRMVLMNEGLLNTLQFRYFRKLTLEDAERCLGEALKLTDIENGDSEIIGQIQYYFALLFIEEGLFYYAKEKLLLAQRLTKNKVTLVHIYNELGKASVKLLEFEDAEDYFEKARNLAMQHSYQYGLNYNIYYRGLLYMDLNQTENACSHFLTALYDFLRKKHYPEVGMIYELLSQLYQSQNSEKSDKYLEESRMYIGMIEQDSEAENPEEIIQWMSS